MRKQTVLIACGFFLWIAGCGEFVSKNSKNYLQNSAVEKISYALTTAPNTTPDTELKFDLDKSKCAIYRACAKEMGYDPLKLSEFSIMVMNDRESNYAKVEFTLPTKKYHLFSGGKLKEYFDISSLCVKSIVGKDNILNYATIVTINSVSPQSYKKSKIRLLIRLKCKLAKPKSDFWIWYKLEPISLTVQKLND